MNRGIAILAVCALFISGVAIGALGMHLYSARRLPWPAEAPPMADRFFGDRDHLGRLLGLSDDQRAEIAAILEDSRRQGEQLRHRMRPEVEALIRGTQERIYKVLTEEQRERFDEMRRGDRRPLERLFLGPMAGREDGHPPGPGGPHGRRRSPRP